MKQCQYKYWNDIGCIREVHNGSFCILHSKDEKKDPKIFQTIFEEELKEQIQKNDYLCLEGILFPAYISFGSVLPIDKPISFRGSTFCGLADFGNIVFKESCDLGDVEFRCSVSFRDVTFYEDVSFGNGVFKGTVCFLRTRFMGSVSFHEACFEDKEDHNDCMARDFHGYSGAQQIGEIFESTQGFSFTEAIFEQDLTFSDTSFSGSCLDFSGSKVKGKFYFDGKFELNKFSLAGAELTGQSSIKILERRRVSIDAENAHFNDECELFINAKRKHWVSLKFVLGEKTALRFPLIARDIRDSWYLETFRREHPIIYIIWNITSKCGRSMLRWSLLSLSVILMFSSAYWIVGQAGFVHKADLSIFSYFYFSVVTITTLGFGDIAPSSLATQILVVLEVIIGYVMLGGLISIFSNKLARRS